MTTNEKWTPTVREGETLQDVPLDRWIGEALGAASTCWNPRPTGEFDSVEAARIHDALHGYIQMVVGGVIAGTIKAMNAPMEDLPGGMKDDSREHDWAARRIRQLESQLGGVVRDVALLKPNVFTDTGFCRVTELAKRVSAETNRLNALRDRVNKLEQYLDSGSAEESLGEPAEFSVPIGQDPENARSLRKYQSDLDDELDGIPSISEAKREYDKGMHAGVKAALDNGEQRIRECLGRMGWHKNSPATESVIRALRGQST